MSKRILITPKASQDLEEYFENYLIFYLSDDEKITIIRIIYASRDIDKILNQSSN